MSSDNPDKMDVDSGSGSPGSSVKRPASAITSSPSSAGSQAELQEKVKAYFEQLTSGCGRRYCSNPKCASNPAFVRPSSPNETAALALQLAFKSTHSLCTKVNPLSRESIESLVNESEKAGDFKLAIRRLGEFFSSSEAINESFYDMSVDVSDTNPSVDLPNLQQAFAILMKHENLKNCTINGLQSLLSSLRVASRDIRSYHQLRLFYILMLHPITREADFKDILTPLCAAISQLPQDMQAVLVNWWSQFSSEQLRGLLTMLQDFLSARVFLTATHLNRDEAIKAGTKVLGLVYEANSRLQNPIAYQEFYNDPINEQIDINHDFKEWRHKAGGFSFCSYPFLLNARTKSRVLQRESEEQMVLRHRQAVARALLTGYMSLAYLRLDIHRQHLIPNTIEQLSRYDDPDDLKMALKVHFVGEEAVDEGGPQKEFFQLIVREIFNANYGMFTHDEESRTYWFNSNSQDFSEFELIGKIIGIAIYNSVILDVHFPFVVYKKLKGIKPTFQDMLETFSTEGRSLKQLLEYDGDDIEDVFGLNFQIRKEVFGEIIVHNLKLDGENIPVNKANRQEFVDLYVKYLLEDSVEQQFAAFQRGFDMVTSGPAMDLFNVDELQLLVCGSQELDFAELERTTRYENGYTAEHPTIKYFWEVVHAMTLEQKKKLLTFATGSDRAPIGGLGDLNLVILRHGEDSDRLPQAHTCFNYLLLPEYGTKEKLKDRLLTAISNAEGFGMK